MQYIKQVDTAFFITNTGELAMKAERDRKVFIVEDNEMHSMMMDYLLSKENGFRILRFKTGEEMLQKINVKPDIIILDYELPGINGMQTFEQIKKYDPKIPVVVVTENRNMQLAQEFLNAGAYEYILKEHNAFDRLTGVINKVFRAIAKREYEASNKVTLLLVGAFIFLIILSSIISYLVLRH